MLKLILAAMAAGALLAMSYLPASAKKAGIDLRQSLQAAAIERGRADGRITWREGLKLRSEQRRIKRLEASFRESDGRLERHERLVIHDLLDEARRHIAIAENDGQRRHSALPRIGR